jgi:hypothetical protein
MDVDKALRLRLNFFGDFYKSTDTLHGRLLVPAELFKQQQQVKKRP